MASSSAVPDILYGTAFAFEDSARLVESALEAGFRGIDTAGSGKAYREKLVGEGITAFLRTNESAKREDIYVCLTTVARACLTRARYKQSSRHSTKEKTHQIILTM